MNTTTPLKNRVIKTTSKFNVFKNGEFHDSLDTEKGAKKMVQNLQKAGNSASYRSAT